MPSKKLEETSNNAATLSERALHTLSQVLQDIRSTVSHIRAPSVSPLAVLDGTAVDALKDLYYIVNNEDPLNAMPARKIVLEQRLVRTALLPLANALHCDPASQHNRKRWSVPMYQTLRLLSVLSIPVSQHNEMLKPGCSLDLDLLKLRTDFALDRPAMTAFVALLQYYIERKAEKQVALASAEDSKLEDARIDNIMRFFRNILSPPRADAGPDIKSRDRGVHLALVAALVEADFYSSLIVLFSTKEDAAAQYSDLVFLIADVYAQTLRHTTPQQIYQSFRAHRKSRRAIKFETEDAEETGGRREASVFDEASEDKPVRQSSLEQTVKLSSNSAQSSGLRAAIQRERAFVGGSRAVTKSARWTSLHSGGFITTRRQSIANGALGENLTSESRKVTAENASGSKSSIADASDISAKRVISTYNAIQSKLSLNPNLKLKDNLRINSELLCLQVAKGRTKVLNKESHKTTVSETMRKDLQEDGLRGVVNLVTELTDEGLDHFLYELRGRIEETKTRSLTAEAEVLIGAQRAFLTIIGSVVGFQRERFGKVYKQKTSGASSLVTQIHQNNMKALLAADLKVFRKEWISVKSAIGIETFRLVFRILVEACDAVKENLKQELQPEDVERATFAIVEMMKMLQGMAIVDEEKNDPSVKDGEQILADIRNNGDDLTTREIALNTIEQLFEEEAFLNAPADLAKDYNVKNYSFQHLANIVEVTYAFTTILLDEKELTRLQVSKKKLPKKARNAQKPEGNSNENKSDPTSEEGSVTRRESCEVEEMGMGIEHGEKGTSVEKTQQKNSEKQDLKTVMGSNGPQDGLAQLPTEPSESGRSPKAAKGNVKDSSFHEDNEEDKIVDCKSFDAEGMDEDGELNDVDSDNSLDDSDVFESCVREIESVGIIKRFANFRALQSLLLPIRAALCNASSLTGSIYNIPDGAGPLLSPVVVAKSVHALAAIWRVAKSQERGALCGQFFTFSTIHVLNTVLDALKKDGGKENSVLACFGVFAKDATKKFLSWLHLNPGLALDMFFPMDKQSCISYVSTMRHRELLNDERNRREDSRSDSDTSALVLERRDERRVDEDSDDEAEFEGIEQRATERAERKQRQKRTHLRRNVVEHRRRERHIEEDEDVDDLDNLNIGICESSSDTWAESDNNAVISDINKQSQKMKNEGKKFCRLRTSRGRRQQKSNAVIRDYDGAEKKGQKRQSKRKTVEKSLKERVKEKLEKEASDQKKEFESSDEYNEEDMKIIESIKSDSSVSIEDPQDGRTKRWNLRRRRSIVEKPVSSDVEVVKPRKRRLRQRKSKDEDSSELSSAGKFTDEESNAALEKILRRATDEQIVWEGGARTRKQPSHKKRRMASVDENRSADDVPIRGEKIMTPEPSKRKEDETEFGTSERGSSIDTSQSAEREKTDAESELEVLAKSRSLTEGKRKRIVVSCSEDDTE